jgi:hypothetical protein
MITHTVLDLSNISNNQVVDNDLYLPAIADYRSPLFSFHLSLQT